MQTQTYGPAPSPLGVALEAQHAADRAELRAARDALERTIEDAFAFLDAIDAEDEDLEPSLGSLTSGIDSSCSSQELWAHGSRDDREEENEGGGDVLDEPHDEDADLETTAPERAGQGFVRCGADDAEEEPDLERTALERNGGGFGIRGEDDDEDGADLEAVNEDGGDILDAGEPSLGATSDVDQERAWAPSDGSGYTDGEPSLGWTVDGRLGGTDDRERVAHADYGEQGVPRPARPAGGLPERGAGVTEANTLLQPHAARRRGDNVAPLTWRRGADGGVFVVEQIACGVLRMHPVGR